MNIPRARQTVTRVRPSSYSFVAEAQGHRVLFYREFGSYQGEWLLFSRDGEHFYLWKDYYGSCSGCDSLQSEFYSGSDEYEVTDPKIVEFVKGYKPFLKMTMEAATRIAEEKGNLLQVLPRNRREWYDSDFNNDDVGRQLALIVKGEAGTISASEILEIDNQETRRIAIERFDAGLFVRDTEAVLMHEEGDNQLYRIARPEGEEDFVFLYVKDPSTERRYVLRVPPGMRKVNEARAFTFGIPAAEFRLTVET